MLTWDKVRILIRRLDDPMGCDLVVLAYSGKDVDVEISQSLDRTHPDHFDAIVITVAEALFGYYGFVVVFDPPTRKSVCEIAWNLRYAPPKGEAKGEEVCPGDHHVTVIRTDNRFHVEHRYSAPAGRVRRPPVLTTERDIPEMRHALAIWEVVKEIAEAHFKRNGGQFEQLTHLDTISSMEFIL